jgi:hypothetical protein
MRYLSTLSLALIVLMALACTANFDWRARHEISLLLRELLTVQKSG